jgi:1-phosphatidylinositol phosphodiesterase
MKMKYFFIIITAIIIALTIEKAYTYNIHVNDNEKSKIIAMGSPSTPTRTTYDDSKGYSHEKTTKNSNENWMRSVDGSKKLNELSIPGTHDSLSLYGGDAVEAQSMDLNNQLKAGIRFFDVRCYEKAGGTTFYIYHGPTYQKITLDKILNDMKNFLIKHPTEVLLVSIKQEIFDNVNISYNYKSITNEEFTKIYAIHKQKYAQYIWVPTSGIPSLNETRGKIIIVNRWDPEGSGLDNGVGLAYGSYFNALDDYKLNSNWDLYKKWQGIKDKLELLKINYNNFEVTFLSGSGGSFPYFVASGHSNPKTGAPALLTGMTTPGWKYTYPDFPLVSCTYGNGICSIAFKGTNILTYDYIERRNPSFVGIILADFPADALINTIIKRNN